MFCFYFSKEILKEHSKKFAAFLHKHFSIENFFRRQKTVKHIKLHHSKKFSEKHAQTTLTTAWLHQYFKNVLRQFHCIGEHLFVHLINYMASTLTIAPAEHNNKGIKLIIKIIMRSLK